MPALSLQVVDSRRDLKAFIDLPYRLHRHEPCWVPPLRREEKKAFSRDNPLYRQCAVRHFLLRQGDGRVAGRISASVNHRAVAHWGTPTGFFGDFVCIDDREAARMLIDGAVKWLRDQGMKEMRGPWCFASQEFGLLVDGYDRPPMVMASFDPPHYGAMLESAGMQKVKDLLVYDLERKNFKLPDRIQRFAQRLETRYPVTIRPIELSRLKEETRTLMRLGNAATLNNWGFIPVAEDEADDLAESLRPIVDPDFVLLAEINGEAVGYLIALPDINRLFHGTQGRLTPRLLWRLAFQRKSIKDYRIWALGVVPEFQRRGLDTLFYRHLHERVMARGVERIEANYVLEDNMPMNNPIMKMGFRVCKRYRVYDKKI